jgi:hypothetical protein
MTDKPLALHLAEVFEIEGDYRTAAELRRLHEVNAPPQREWQGLTDEEINNILEEIMSLLPGAVRLPPGWTDTVRAIEAKLKLKNGYAEEKNSG